ncbi:MAG: DUF362 domain-containing protein [Lachnospiraceae bacterium]|nr:DUF362 domain-containing protein [Lachnospiraceae bacterium]
MNQDYMKSRDFSASDSGKIWKIFGTDYKEMTKKILAAADLAGRIGDKKTRIGIKPNLVVASPAQFGATTHPEVVAGIIEYLQERDFSNIIVTEGSWVGDRTALAFDYCGYRALTDQYGVPLVDTQKEKWHEVDCAGMKLQITDVVDRIDFLINVPVMKGHCQTKMTCALKNMKGLLPNREKSRFHRMGLHKPIAHLQKGIHQDFIVVDHICGDLDFEEGGNPVVRNCVMAATDPVLVDSYACHLMQYHVDEVPYIRMAEKLGVGTTDLSKAEIIRLNGDSEEDELPRQNRILEVSYAVEEVDSCSACYGNLVHALNLLREEGLLDKLKDRIAIGQGMQGRTGPLGIGRCTSGFDTCIMGCPPEPEKIYEELKAYILAHA